MRILTRDTDNHNGNLSHELPRTRDSDIVSMPLSIPARKKVEYDLRCLLPYEAVVCLAKGACNNLAMATPLFAFSCNNVRTKDRE